MVSPQHPNWNLELGARGAVRAVCSIERFAMPARMNPANVEIHKQDVGRVKRALFLVKDTGGVFQETLRIAVDGEKGKGRFASQRTNEDNFNRTGG